MKIIEQILKTIYPKTCILCGQILEASYDDVVCVCCSNQIQYLTDNVCHKCGKPLAKKGVNRCYDCMYKEHTYEEGRALWPYEGLVKNAITQYKFHNQKQNYKYLASRMLYYYIHYTSWKVDLITSVPLHKDKLNQRTYNQAALIASYLGENLSIPVNNKALLRTKNTQPQKELKDKERPLNVKGAFKIGNDLKVKGKNILIIDDIYTTGSTIDACSTTLREHGAKKVYFLVLAIGRGY